MEKTLDKAPERFEQYEFNCPELGAYMHEIQKQSIELINSIIKQYSLIQIGDTVEVKHIGEWIKVEVCNIQLCVISSWTPDRYSFRYHGKLINKKGLIMKGRLPIWFSGYKVDGKLYTDPSYNRHPIVPASMKADKI